MGQSGCKQQTRMLQHRPHAEQAKQCRQLLNKPTAAARSECGAGRKTQGEGVAGGPQIQQNTCRGSETTKLVSNRASSGARASAGAGPIRADTQRRRRGPGNAGNVTAPRADKAGPAERKSRMKTTERKLGKLCTEEQSYARSPPGKLRLRRQAQCSAGRLAAPQYCYSRLSGDLNVRTSRHMAHVVIRQGLLLANRSDDSSEKKHSINSPPEQAKRM